MTQQCKVWIDNNLVKSTKGIGELLTHMEKENITTIIEKLPVENSIFWTRSSKVMSKDKQNQNDEVQHDHILVKLETEAFLDYLTDFNSNQSPAASNLCRYIGKVKTDAKITQITFLIPNFKSVLKNSSNTKASQEARDNYNEFVKINRSTKTTAKSKKHDLSKSEINFVILHLELKENVCVRSYESGDELRDLVLSYSKSISEYDQKQSQASGIIFCEKSSEKSQGKVSKDPINLWKEMIECFPMVSSDQAQAICLAYPSPLLLKKAYEKASSPELLLADIQVRRGAGVLSSVRRIGPELSQKIHKLFTAFNADELLVNE